MGKIIKICFPFGYKHLKRVGVSLPACQDGLNRIRLVKKTLKCKSGTVPVMCLPFDIFLMLILVLLKV